MNYLLDTHTLIWAIEEDHKLSKTVTQTLKNKQNAVFVSALSFWEISLKFSLNKLNLGDDRPDDFLKLALQSGFQLISLTPEESSSYHKLTLTNHKDPFDRMLIWQAINRNLILVTKDENLKRYKPDGLKTLW